MSNEYTIPTDLIGPAELAKLISLSEATIRSDVTRRPDRLPKRFLMPGSNRLRWSKAAVLAWIEAQQL